MMVKMMVKIMARRTWFTQGLLPRRRDLMHAAQLVVGICGKGKPAALNVGGPLGLRTPLVFRREPPRRSPGTPA